MISIGKNFNQSKLFFVALAVVVLDRLLGERLNVFLSVYGVICGCHWSFRHIRMGIYWLDPAYV